MAEGEGLEPPSPKAPVFRTGGLPIILALRSEGSLKDSILSRGCFPFSGWALDPSDLSDLSDPSDVSDLSDCTLGAPDARSFTHQAGTVAKYASHT